MQTIVHRNKDRGRADHGWLKTRFSFSFADWYDPSRMGFGTLRVLNDDVVLPGHGFDPHSHRDMEIITIVTKGAVSHEDSMGNTYAVPAGDVQVMSAGTGVVHSERNASETEPLELFQIWITPRARNLSPSYSQKTFGLGGSDAGGRNRLELLVSGTGGSGESDSSKAVKEALSINQDAWVYYGSFDSGQTLSYSLHDPNNGVYLFVIDGSVALKDVAGVVANASIADQTLGERDAIGISGVAQIEAAFTQPSQILLFEVSGVS